MGWCDSGKIMDTKNYCICNKGRSKKATGRRKILLFLFLLPSTVLYAAFQDTGWGTCAGGMGNTFTSIANDSSATLWNPAGIYQIEMLETVYMYNKLFTGIEDVNLYQMFAAVVYPTKIGAFGLTITDSHPVNRALRRRDRSYKG